MPPGSKAAALEVAGRRMCGGYTSCGQLRYALKTMHDLNYFRDHLDEFAEMARKRNTTLDLEAFRALDKERRELITANEQRKAQRNKASDEIARLRLLRK